MFKPIGFSNGALKNGCGPFWFPSKIHPTNSNTHTHLLEAPFLRASLFGVCVWACVCVCVSALTVQKDRMTPFGLPLQPQIQEGYPQNKGCAVELTCPNQSNLFELSVSPCWSMFSYGPKTALSVFSKTFCFLRLFKVIFQKGTSSVPCSSCRHFGMSDVKSRKTTFFLFLLLFFFFIFFGGVLKKSEAPRAVWCFPRSLSLVPFSLLVEISAEEGQRPWPARSSRLAALASSACGTSSTS